LAGGRDPWRTDRHDDPAKRRAGDVARRLRAAVESQSSRGDDCFDGDNEEVRAEIFMSIVVAWMIVNAWVS
jgi:hypothetical protein